MEGQTRVGRVAPRFSLGIPTRYQVSGEAPIGTGVIQNISKSGALVDDESCKAPVGSRIRLSFSLLPTSQPVKLSAEIVRMADTGFAVRFRDLDPRNRQLLEAALPKVAQLSDRRPNSKL